MQVQKLRTDDAKDWQQVADDQQIFVTDLIDASTDPDANMTVGYARIAKGEALHLAFPYDEVLILTKGVYAIRTEHGETVTAEAGDFLYLPANSSNESFADEDTEMVYVANPPAVYAAHVAAASESAG